MTYPEEYEHKQITRWPFDALKSFRAKLRVRSGHLNTDGEIWADNRPVMIKKQSWDVSQASNAEFDIFTLPGWLGCNADDMIHYYIDLSIQFVVGGNEAVTDDFMFRAYEGAAEEERFTIADYGSFAATRGGAPNAYPAVCRLYCHPGLTVVKGYFTEWASTETHLGRVVAIAYRMTPGICAADGSVSIGP